MIRFEWPWVLALLGIIPVLLVWRGRRADTRPPALLWGSATSLPAPGPMRWLWLVVRLAPWAALGLALLAAARAEAPAEFRWRAEPYEFVADPPAIDLLTGSDAARRAIEAGASLDELAAGFVEFERAFAERRAPHLLSEYA